MAAGLTVLDGANCIGGNKILIESSGSGLLLDFGKNFGRYARFYEEYLKGRTTRGIHDLLYLRLIPWLDIYRRDLIPPDVPAGSLKGAQISALLISHAHLDHCGHAGLLKCSIPFVASPMSFAILKAYQDIGRGSTEADIVYTSRRRPIEGEPHYLKADSRSYIGRDLYCTSPPSSGLLEFVSGRPGQQGESVRAKRLIAGRCGCLEDLSLPFQVHPCEVDHSIPGACGYLLEGECTLAYTGDLRLHGKEGGKSLKFADAARSASVLIVEGTRIAGDEGCAPMTTEADVLENCRRAVGGAKGLVVADFSARNFERLDVFREVAGRSDRELVITAKDAYQLLAMQLVDGRDRMKGLRVYDEIVDHRARKWEVEAVMAQAAPQYIGREEISRHPEQYILAFSFFDMNHLLDIKPKGGLYIYSSCEPFNEEMEIDLKRLSEWLEFFGIRRCGFSIGRGRNGDLELRADGGYHASGHASPEDLERLIDRIDPDLIVPVHTEHAEWFSERFKKVLVPVTGERYEL